MATPSTHKTKKKQFSVTLGDFFVKKKVAREYLVFRKVCSLLVIFRKEKKRQMSVQWTEVFLTSHHPSTKPTDSTHVCRLIN
jgi:hypothetical protein